MAYPGPPISMYDPGVWPIIAECVLKPIAVFNSRMGQNIRDVCCKWDNAITGLNIAQHRNRITKPLIDLGIMIFGVKKIIRSLAIIDHRKNMKWIIMLVSSHRGSINFNELSKQKLEIDGVGETARREIEGWIISNHKLQWVCNNGGPMVWENYDFYNKMTKKKDQKNT